MKKHKVEIVCKWFVKKQISLDFINESRYRGQFNTQYFLEEGVWRYAVQYFAVIRGD